MAEDNRPVGDGGEGDALAAVAELSVKLMREIAALHERIEGIETRVLEEVEA